MRLNSKILSRNSKLHVLLIVYVILFVLHHLLFDYGYAFAKAQTAKGGTSVRCNGDVFGEFHTALGNIGSNHIGLNYD